MVRRVHAVVLFAAVVALAGCSGGSPGATTTAGTATGATGSATPADGSEQALQTSDSAIQSFSYPEGASPQGIEDLSSLLEAHSSAVSGTSFTVTGSTTFSADTGGESDDAGLNYTIRYDAADNEIRRTLSGGDQGTLDTYADGSTKYFRVQNESGTEYGTAQPGSRIAEGGPQEVTGESVLRSLIQRGEFSASGVFTRNGTEYVQYNLTSVSSSSAIDVGERTYSGYLIIDSEGIIHEADLTIGSAGNSGLQLTRQSHIEFSNFGNTSVEEPSWTREAG